jgi:predicted DNA-binding transcriptional regulator YafY
MGNEFLGTLLKAIKERDELIVHYQRFGETMPKHYTYHPYVLKEYRNRWYVTGKDIGNKRMITLALERIKELLPTGKNFEPDATFEARKFFKHSFGISVIDDFKPEKIKLKFEPSEAPYIKSQPLHETQQIVEDSATAFVIQLEVIPSYELKSQILSYGDKVHVLSPEGLKKEHVAILKNALKKYI